MPHFALTYDEAERRLRSAGVPASRGILVGEVDDVGQAFDALRAPVVVKATGLLHKSDTGGVALGLHTKGEAVAAAARILEAVGPDGLPLVVQEQSAGLEMLVGVRRDAQAGVAVVVGLGGTATEVHGDVVTAIAPLDSATAHRMLRELRGWPLLEGFRGQPGHDVSALADLVVAVSSLAVLERDIVELDLNPVLVGPAGAGVVVADARVICSDDVPATARPRADLTRMMRPDHVAVVGVSDDPDKVGARLFRYLRRHGYTGRLDAVHPAGGQVDGYPRAASLEEVDGSPDLVCVTVPSRFVLDVAREAVDKKVGGVIVHSSDFAETGPEGKATQDALVDILAEAGIPLAGPNDMGMVAPATGMAASISGGLEEALVPGTAALLTSSGALGSCLATRLMGSQVGLSYWVHAGNEADVVIADYLDWLVDDPATASVGLLLEDIKDGPRFIDAGRRMARAGKAMFAYNMVRSDKGRDAALSHTGAMVGSYEVREAVVRAAGMVSVPSLRVLEDAMLLSSAGPTPAGTRLVAVTFSGGACSIIADAAAASTVELPDLSAATRDAVRPYVPSYSAVRNPFDMSYQMLTEADAFEKAIDALVSSGEYDALLVQFTTNADPYAETLARKVVRLRASSPIPLYVSRYGGTQLAPRALQVYADAGVPVLDAPDRAAAAIDALMRAHQLRDEVR